MMALPNHVPTLLLDAVLNVGSAADIPSLDVPRSIFGDRAPLPAVPAGFQREIQALCHGTLRERALTLARATFSFPGARGQLGHPSGPCPLPPGGPRPFPDERWFFINGVCSDLRIAEMNRHELSRFTGRQVELLYNATDGFVVDLVECAVGRTFDAVTEAVVANFPPLAEALCDGSVNRVVLVGHSQGTIISSVMLKIVQEALLRDPPVPLVGTARPSSERQLARTIVAGTKDAAFRAAFSALAAHPTELVGKLELYCFANCATSMAPFFALGKPARRAPFIESYGNENDVVARLGVLAAPRGVGGTRIEGERYYVKDAWGHFLNAHYLGPMYEAMGAPAQPHGAPRAYTPFPGNLGQRPRLWEYAHGGTPAAWP